MQDELLQDLIKLKEKFIGAPRASQDLLLVEQWEEDAKKALMIVSLKNHDGVQIILKAYAEEIETINRLLLDADSKVLSDFERDRLLDRKAMHKKFLKFFEDAEVTLKNIKEDVDDNL